MQSFSDLEAKEKHRKRTEKRNVHEFSVCVFSEVRTANATEKRPLKIQPENPSQHKAKSGVTMWQSWKLSICHLRSKNYPEKPQISLARSSAPLRLPTNFRRPPPPPPNPEHLQKIMPLCQFSSLRMGKAPKPPKFCNSPLR